MKKLNVFIIVLIIVTGGLELVNIYFANSIAADSVKASKIRNEIAILDEKNLLLRSKIVEVSSFDMIASRAAQLGFIESNEHISLLAPQEFAAR